MSCDHCNLGGGSAAECASSRAEQEGGGLWCRHPPEQPDPRSLAASTSRASRWTPTAAAATPSAPTRSSWSCPAQTPVHRDGRSCSPCRCSLAASAAPGAATSANQTPRPHRLWPAVPQKSPQTRITWGTWGKGLPGRTPTKQNEAQTTGPPGCTHASCWPCPLSTLTPSLKSTGADRGVSSGPLDIVVRL